MKMENWTEKNSQQWGRLAEQKTWFFVSILLNIIALICCCYFFWGGAVEPDIQSRQFFLLPSSPPTAFHRSTHKKRKEKKKSLSAQWVSRRRRNINRWSLRVKFIDNGDVLSSDYISLWFIFHVAPLALARSSSREEHRAIKFNFMSWISKMKISFNCILFHFSTSPLSAGTSSRFVEPSKANVVDENGRRNERKKKSSVLARWARCFFGYQKWTHHIDFCWFFFR